MTQSMTEFETQLIALRPKLHRYCARMVGSALDAEDIVQDGIAAALRKLPSQTVRNPESWLFRIVHNRALDHLRRAENVEMLPLPEDPIDEDSPPPFEQKEMATFALSIFMQLTPLQRCAVILKDVMGYSLSEVSELLDLSVGGVKSALHRGRDNLKQISAREPTTQQVEIKDNQRALLTDYVQRFSTRDFDGIRARLLEDVELELVHRVQSKGAKRVGRYYSNYKAVDLFSVFPCTVEGRLAMHVTDEEGAYYVLLNWRDDRLSAIKDFRYARYVCDSVEVTFL